MFSASPVVPLGLGFFPPLVVQNSPEASQLLVTTRTDAQKTPLARDFLKQGFLKTSSSVVACPQAVLVVLGLYCSQVSPVD